MMTTQIPNYNSLYWDPLTRGVDAFAQTDWSLSNNYVNAPFGLLPRILDIVIKQQATATVIAPNSVASSNMVSKINNTSYRQSNSTTSVTKDSNLRRSTCRTSEKQGLGSVSLENLWKTRLRCLGWSKRASTQSMFSLAQPTLKTYNSYVNR